jgi:hypothetical protein
MIIIFIYNQGFLFEKIILNKEIAYSNFSLKILKK